MNDEMDFTDDVDYDGTEPTDNAPSFTDSSDEPDLQDDGASVETPGEAPDSEQEPDDEDYVQETVEEEVASVPAEPVVQTGKKAAPTVMKPPIGAPATAESGTSSPRPAPHESAGEEESESETDRLSAVRWEMNRAIADNVPLEKYEGFTAPQLRQIRLALKEGPRNCAATIADTKYNYLQMELIRRGFEEGLEIEKYSNPEFDANQMWEIMDGLRYHIDVTPYANPVYSSEQMEILKEAILDNVDISIFSDPSIPAESMQYYRTQARRNMPPLKDRMRRAFEILRGPKRVKERPETPDY